MKSSYINTFFNKFSNTVTRLSGKPVAFVIACLLIIIWALSGPLFDFSDTWQLVINTGTTVITFLMVFIIQQSQNKDTMALQLKLNELIACKEDASNRLIDVESLTSDELEMLKKFYARLSILSKKENNLYTSHSLDEATLKHQNKRKNIKKPFPKVL
ncbi:MAG TPA: low affinity iron permease family protein [Cyclobacteriaceae bacterium]